jgi:hypothetical protein
MMDHGDLFEVSHSNDHYQVVVVDDHYHTNFPFFAEEEKKIEVIDLTDLDD